MKIKKLIALIFIAVTTFCCFSCGNEKNEAFIGDIYLSEDFAFHPLVSAEEITSFDMKKVERIKITSVTLGELDTIKVFDSESGRKVYEITGNGVIVQPVTSDAFSVCVGGEKEVRRISDGKTLAKIDEKDEVLVVSDNLIRAGSAVIIKRDNGQLEVVEGADEFTFLPQNLTFMQNGNYYSQEKNELLVYNPNLRPLCRFALPSSAQVFETESGDFIVQKKLESEDGEYDYIHNGKKYCLFTLLLKVKTGESVSLRPSLVVESAVKTGRGVVHNVKMIENEWLSPTEKTVTFNDRLEVVTEYARPLGYFLLPFTEVSGKRYYTANESLFDENGQVIATAKFNQKYLIGERAIYDFSKKQALDLNGYSVCEILPCSVVLEDGKGEKYIFGGEDLISLGKTTIKKKSERVLEVKSDGKYIYYNENGAPLLTSEQELFYACTVGESVYFRSADYRSTWRFSANALQTE